MINLSRPPSEPSLKDVLDLYKKDIMLSLNCHAIGTIEEFDPSKQTCKAKISYSKTIFERKQDGTYSPNSVEYPILADCPVIVLSGGSSGMTFPIKKGDSCLVLFNDRDIDNWFAGKTSGPVASSRLHSMADAICLVGIRPLNNLIPNYDSENPVLFNQDLRVVPKPSKLLIENSTDSLGALMQDLIGHVQDLIQQVSILTVTCAAPGNPSSPPINAVAITTIGAELTTTASKIQGLLE